MQTPAWAAAPTNAYSNYFAILRRPSLVHRLTLQAELPHPYLTGLRHVRRPPPSTAHLLSDHPNQFPALTPVGQPSFDTPAIREILPSQQIVASTITVDPS